MTTCPRRPHAPKCHDCVGAVKCEERMRGKIAAADLELKLRKAKGYPVDTWATKASDYVDAEPDKE